MSQSKPLYYDIIMTSYCRRPGTMRRGMLMTVLQQYALDQPVWKGKPGEQ